MSVDRLVRTSFAKNVVVTVEEKVDDPVDGIVLTAVDVTVEVTVEVSELDIVEDPDVVTVDVIVVIWQLWNVPVSIPSRT